MVPLPLAYLLPIPDIMKHLSHAVTSEKTNICIHHHNILVHLLCYLFTSDILHK